MTGLTPGKEYKFRVAAVNAEGESEPLVAEESIIAKNPFGKARLPLGAASIINSSPFVISFKVLPSQNSFI